MSAKAFPAARSDRSSPNHATPKAAFGFLMLLVFARPLCADDPPRRGSASETGPPARGTAAAAKEKRRAEVITQITSLYVRATSALDQRGGQDELKSCLKAILPLAEELVDLIPNAAQKKTTARLVEKFHELHAKAEEAETAGRSAELNGWSKLLLNVVGKLLDITPSPNSSRPVWLIKEFRRLHLEQEEVSRHGTADEAKACTQAILPIAEEVFALEASAQKREEMVSLIASLAMRHNPANCLRRLPVDLLLYGNLPPLPFDYSLATSCSTLALKLARQLKPWAGWRHHPKLPECLEVQGVVLAAQGYAQALSSYEEAASIYKELYPDESMVGREALARTLACIGELLAIHGDRACVQYLRNALTTAQKCYPDGDPRAKTFLKLLGRELSRTGEHEQAIRYYEQAFDLETVRSEAVATFLEFLHMLARNHIRQRNYDQALRRVEEGWGLFRTEPSLKGSQAIPEWKHLLGYIYRAKGDERKAEDLYQDALQEYRSRYPRNRFPYMQPIVSSVAADLGDLYLAQGKRDDAYLLFDEARARIEPLYQTFALSASEIETFRHGGFRDGLVSRLLSASWKDPERDSAVYEQVWQWKCMATASLGMRQRALVLAATSQALGEGDQKELLRLTHELLGLRQTMSIAILTGVTTSDVPPPAGLEGVERAAQEVERKIARLAPSWDPLTRPRPGSFNDLAQRLPANSVFVDFVSYWRGDQFWKPDASSDEEVSTGDRQATRSYAAFVVSPGQRVHRVELGPAKDIEAVVQEWRAAIAHKLDPAEKGHAVRKLVWDPVHATFPLDTRLVLLAPTGLLTQLPWACLPTAGEGRYLLHEYGLAVVPHGSWLRSALDEKPSADDRGLVLAVGDVNYDQQPRDATSHSGAAKQAPVGNRTPHRWPRLTFSAQELSNLADKVGQRRLTVLRGNEASTQQVVARLPEATHLLFSTHGFWATAELRKALNLSATHWSTPAGGPAAIEQRHPALQCALVLAGANQKSEGYLTGEMIAGMLLPNLQTVILSACDSSLGEARLNEGSFSLQRAFHLAGARSVVASLWRLDDQYATEFVTLVYHKLWAEELPPVEAVRQAQLELLERLQKTGGIAAHPYFWAGWSLSGYLGEPARLEQGPAIAREPSADSGHFPAKDQEAAAIGVLPCFLVPAVLAILLAALVWRWRRKSLKVIP
jgi:CHAT domain-containing protein/tetratricopeptide (TPR) repeat protein